MGKRRKVQQASDSVRFAAALIVLLMIVAIVGIALYRAQHPAASTQIATTSSTSLLSENGIVFAGLPVAAPDVGPVEVLPNLAYISGYSDSRKDPLWVAYHVIHVDRPFHLERPKGNFLTDPRTSARVTHDDFTGSGFDRGHMAPNSAIAHCFGEEAQHQTFLLSNICPQSSVLNQKVWEALEKEELVYADNPAGPGDVFIIDGPIFADLNGGPTRKLPAGIAVPTAFYKILIEPPAAARPEPRVFAVIMPQTVKATQLPAQFLASIAQIEKETHLTFLPNLPPEEQSRLKQKTWAMW
ncbi:MAG TPA: DNA/RNA non-specific endonuclease [Phycisphaerae bacterium]|nr:DNA/RNA non-specific endonuclease [Phycisphaerae bacterium]